jgi:FKBP-type peptidyl-prolyl cis-trans isomerase FkpA
MIEVNIEQYKDGKFVPYAFDLDAELKNMEEKEAARIEANKTRAVVETDTVLVHYKGTLEDESVFDNSYDRGEPIEVSLAA